MATKPFIVGITGGSASGKTSVLKDILNAFTEDQICLISQDNYYRTLDFIPVDQNGVYNFDLPVTINHELFAEHLSLLHAGQTIEAKEYTFNNPNVIPRMLIYRPTPIIIVEGLFVFHFPDVATQLDLKVYITAKNSIKLDRRLSRDQAERGLTEELINYQWKHHVRPAYREFVKPHKDQADIVIPNNLHYQKGLEVLLAFLRTKVNS
ncbi:MULTISPECIES: uridine kinase family protein [Spirosoma]|jgi:uridine kinase|uniref:Uridine kinase n=1 Tax=Spirosoma liriopis TaxID=2937440 RepID=A0ABT0HI95_9BACT|nr:MULTISPECIES: uridine kinase [Spirosoma]MCK8491874.1 uridine kinase [Spirosoma liriopis]UHG91195.1 uridine kinase [Spirosoma oryzicola]